MAFGISVYLGDSRGFHLAQLNTPLLYAEQASMAKMGPSDPARRAICSVVPQHGGDGSAWPADCPTFPLRTYLVSLDSALVNTRALTSRTIRSGSDSHLSHTHGLPYAGLVFRPCNLTRHLHSGCLPPVFLSQLSS